MDRNILIACTYVNTEDECDNCEIKIFRYCNGIPLIGNYNNGLIYNSFMNILWSNFGISNISLNNCIDKPYITLNGNYQSPINVSSIIFIFNVIINIFRLNQQVVYQ